MAGFFGGMRVGAQMPMRGALLYRYNNARNQLLWVVVFSVINVVLMLVGADMYFLFSAFVPLVLTSIGLDVCGKYPAEDYGEGYESMEFLPSSVLVVFAAISFAIIGAYLLFWFLSKKQKVAWMIVALVFFALDTGMMLLMTEDLGSMLFDIIFHAWVLYALFSGVRAGLKLKNLPPEEELPLDPQTNGETPLDFSVEE